MSGASGTTSFLDSLGSNLPFSFTYGGVSSAQLLAQWPRTSTTKQIDQHTVETTTTWTDPKTGLQVHWVVTGYALFETVKWIVYFDNPRSARSDVIADVLALDAGISGLASGDWTIHTANGSTARPDDFFPHDISLASGSFRTFGTNGGRPTNGFYSPQGRNWVYLTGSNAPDYYGGDQHGYGMPGMSVSLAFTGTTIKWISPRNIDLGISDIYIDGVKVASVDMYAPSWLKQQVLFSKTDLIDAPHTIEILVTSNKNPSAIGTYCAIDAFEYGTGTDLTMVNDNDPSITYTGLSADSSSVVNGWPYFNVDFGGNGLIVALGWVGQWAVEMDRADADSLRLRGGMAHRPLDSGQRIEDAELTNLWLEAGESIRTPSIVVQPWSDGDWIDAQNTWRRWFVQCHMPAPGGTPVPPLCPTQSNDYFPAQYDTADDQLTWLNAYGEHDATPSGGGHLDHWWIDAGWSQLPPGAQDWNHPGSWTPDVARYPNGLKPINDRAHQLGMRTILWFEPERVVPDTWLYDNHPEWLLKPSPTYTGPNYLLNFADPAVQDWAINHIGDLLVNQAVDVYREDFNIDPLAYWRNTDPDGRRGITQIKYVEGHLRYWAGLKAKKTGLVVDTCASGGRRQDLDTMGVAINLLRSDYVLDALGNQSHVLGVSRWLPLTGGASRVNGAITDTYVARSSMGPSFHHALNINQPDSDWALLKSLATEWHDLSASYYGDFYPLTEASLSQDAWVGWQFDNGNAGFIQAFRRPQSSTGQKTLQLRGLDATASYRVTDRDSGTSRTVSGSDLMSTGLVVSLAQTPSAATIQYRKV